VEAIGPRKLLLHMQPAATATATAAAGVSRVVAAGAPAAAAVADEVLLELTFHGAPGTYPPTSASVRRLAVEVEPPLSAGGSGGGGLVAAPAGGPGGGSGPSSSGSGGSGGISGGLSGGISGGVSGGGGALPAAFAVVSPPLDLPAGTLPRGAMRSPSGPNRALAVAAAPTAYAGYATGVLPHAEPTLARAAELGGGAGAMAEAQAALARGGKAVAELWAFPRPPAPPSSGVGAPSAGEGASSAGGAAGSRGYEGGGVEPLDTPPRWRRRYTPCWLDAAGMQVGTS
jgi:hypothetical protein